MNSYLIFYYYNYSEEKEGKIYSTLVTAKNFKDAQEVYIADNGTGTIVDIKLLQNPNTKYTELKNHIHNTLGITKDDIRKWTKEAIYKIVEKKVNQEYTDGHTMQGIIANKIQQKAYSFWDDKEMFGDYIREKVAHELLKNVHLKVEVVAEKDKTPLKPRLYVKKKQEGELIVKGK